MKMARDVKRGRGWSVAAAILVLTATANLAAEPEARVLEIGSIDRNDDGLTEQQIASVIESSTDVLSCYSDQRLTGQSHTARIKVDQRGRVSRVSVPTTQRRKCVERALRKLRFAKHTKPTSAVVQFRVGRSETVTRALALTADACDSLGIADRAGVRTPGADLDAQLAAAGGSSPSNPSDVPPSAPPLPLASIREVLPTNEYSDAVRLKVEAAYLAGMRRCYKAVLDRVPGITKHVELRLRVGADGRVAAARMVDPGSDRELESCVEQRAASWRFKAQTAESAIVFRIDLSPPSS
jgi:hypothetical protein